MQCNQCKCYLGGGCEGLVPNPKGRINVDLERALHQLTSAIIDGGGVSDALGIMGQNQPGDDIALKITEEGGDA